MLPVIIGIGAGAFWLLKKLHRPSLTRAVGPVSTVPSPFSTAVNPASPGPSPAGTQGMNVGGRVYHIAPGDSGARVWGRFLPALPNQFMAANPGVHDWVHFVGTTAIVLPPNAVDKGPAPMATGIIT